MPLEPPREFVLESNDVHVWSAHFGRNTLRNDHFQNLLSNTERERARRYKFETDRSRFIATRSALRLLLGRYLETDPATIEFELAEFGKPRISGDHELEFNVSHSGSRALFAFTRSRPIGVDLEDAGRRVEIFAVASRFFSSSEFLELSLLSNDDQQTGFFNCWTRKEAFIKAVGSGLSFPLNEFEVSLAPNTPPLLRRTLWDSSEAAKWAVYSIIPAEGFIGAMAIREKKENLMVRHFDFARDFET